MNAGPHLDDDALSAHLDGLDAGPHLAACGECRARLDGLAAAAAAIGAPPAMPTPSVIDAAVDRALDAEARGPRRTVLVALAAAVLVVLGVVSAALVGDEERPSDSDTAALSDESTAGQDAAGDVAFAEDLGELDDQQELRDRVRTVVEPPPTTTTAPGSGGEVKESVGAPMAATAGDSSAVRTSGKDPYCEQAVAEELDRGLGPLVYRATLRWNGTPAVAVAYRVEDASGELDHRLFVLASGSCELLVAQTF